jgi:hypothetical protein
VEEVSEVIHVEKIQRKNICMSFCQPPPENSEKLYTLILEIKALSEGQTI